MKQTIWNEVIKMTGIICALKIEVDGLKSAMDSSEEKTIAGLDFISGKINGKDVVLLECGIGKVNAAIGTQIMIDYYKPDVIINSGIAGSLSKDLKIGDIVISKDCVEHDMNGTATVILEAKSGTPMKEELTFRQIRLHMKSYMNVAKLLMTLMLLLAE